MRIGEDVVLKNPVRQPAPRLPETAGFQDTILPTSLSEGITGESDVQDTDTGAIPGTGPSESRPSDNRAHHLPATPPARTEPLAAQLAQRLAATPMTPDHDAPLELTLDPPELGTIRVSISRGAEGMVLHLQADLPETLDLLRRHGGALAQELQRQGLDHSGFSFSSQNESGRQATTAPPTAIQSDDPDSPAPVVPIRTQLATNHDRSGLDLRL